MSSGAQLIAVVIVLGVLGFGAVQCFNLVDGAFDRPSVGTSEARDPAEGQAAAPAPVDPQLQANRKEFIERLIAEGIFQKVEVPGTTPRLWVTPRFMLLNWEDKEQFVNVVFAYYYPDPSQHDLAMIKIYHSVSGKHIGDYSASFGLELD